MNVGRKRGEGMDQIPVFKLKNYTMRGVRKEDTPALFPCMSDRDIMKFITPHPVQTIAEIEEDLTGRLEGFQQQKEIPWVVENGNKEVIGMFRFHKLNFWHKRTEMGAIIHPNFQRSGVMTEVFRTVIPFGFEELRLNRIAGDIFAKNEGSRQLLKKFGFLAKKEY